MNTHPMTPAGVLAALAMIDIRRWPKEAQFLALVGRYGDGEIPVELAFDHAKEVTGWSVNTVRSWLAKLVENRVLEHEAGTGSTGHMYRVNRDVRQWNDVPWKRSVSIVEAEVAMASGALRASENSSSRVFHVFDARRRRFVARNVLGKRAMGYALSRDSLRENARERIKPSRKTSWETDRRASASSGSSPFSQSSNELSFSDQEKKHFNALKAALYRRHEGSKEAFLSGAPRQRVEALVRSIDDVECAQLVDALLRDAPRGLPIPELVTWVIDRHEMGELVRPGARLDGNALLRRQLGVDRQLTAEDLERAVASGDEVLIVQLSAELADIDTQVANLDIESDSSENDQVG